MLSDILTGDAPGIVFSEWGSNFAKMARNAIWHNSASFETDDANVLMVWLMVAGVDKLNFSFWIDRNSKMQGLINSSQTSQEESNSPQLWLKHLTQNFKIDHLYCQKCLLCLFKFGLSKFWSSQIYYGNIHSQCIVAINLNQIKFIIAINLKQFKTNVCTNIYDLLLYYKKFYEPSY